MACCVALSAALVDAPMLDRSLMKLGVTLYRLGLSGLIRRLGRNNPKVLLFHDIAATENDFVAGLGTTMHPDIFADHVAYLSQHYDITSIDELMTRRGRRPRVSIAFDDGYRSVLQNALPIMQRHNVTAIIYLITRAVGNRELVWVNELNYLLRHGGPRALAGAQRAFGLSTDANAADVISAARVAFDQPTLDRLLSELRVLAVESPLAALAANPLYLDWDDVRSMATQGIIFGNHTASHPNMGRLTLAEQMAEISEAQSTLCKERVETVHFAYPFGHHNDATPRLAREAGLHWIAEVGGSNRGGEAGHVGRVDIRANNNAELFAQIEVVEPVKALLRRLLARPKAGWEPSSAQVSRR